MSAPVFAVLGAGAWGTALALHLARLPASHRVTLWARDAAQAQAMLQTRFNVRYLPGFPLPPALRITASLADAVRDADFLIAAPPMAALPELIGRCRDMVSTTATKNAPPFFWLSKGLLTENGAGERALANHEREDVFLPHQKLAPLWFAAVGAISGPSFAQEVAQGLPTALVVAGTGRAAAETLAAHLRGDTLRVYTSDDLAGVEVGGAVKNVLAIAAGICDGLKLGHNARATLITRGLAEMARLAKALGGQRATLMGLAGLGDLVLTCTGDLSRNRQVGLMLAEDIPLPDILARLGHVAEGVPAAAAVTKLAQRHNIDLPISAAVSQALRGNLTARMAVDALLKRAPGIEA